MALGSSGYEQSVIAFLEDLWRIRDKSVLNLGTYWGVYMGSRRPSGMTKANEMAKLSDEISKGTVSLDFSVRPNGAVHQWRKDPPKKLSVGLGS